MLAVVLFELWFCRRERRGRGMYSAAPRTLTDILQIIQMEYV